MLFYAENLESIKKSVKIKNSSNRTTREFYQDHGKPAAEKHKPLAHFGKNATAKKKRSLLHANYQSCTFLCISESTKKSAE